MLLPHNEVVAADKSLGQHFLHDSHIIEKIASTVPAEAQAIVEVGPGRGALTRHLARHPLPLHAIEKDPRFAPLLAPFVPAENIHFQDALKMDFSLLPSKDVWLVSNLPYNVGVPLTRKFIALPQITSMTLMFQREVAEKILATSMNSLKALVQNYFTCRRLLNVPAGAFTPPPQVRSTVIVFSRTVNPVVPLQELDSYEQFLRQLFNHKRKQIKTILRRMMPDRRCRIKKAGMGGFPAPAIPQSRAGPLPPRSKSPVPMEMRARSQSSVAKYYALKI